MFQVILGDNSHIYNYEGGGISALGGLAFHVVHNEPNGELPLEQLQAAVRPDDSHCSRSGLVCLESSHNRCGGTVLSLEYMEAVKQWADGHGMPVHLDGARVFNAAQALGVEVGAIASHVTSLQFCLSKVTTLTDYMSQTPFALVMHGTPCNGFLSSQPDLFSSEVHTHDSCSAMTWTFNYIWLAKPGVALATHAATWCILSAQDVSDVASMLAAHI